MRLENLVILDTYVQEVSAQTVPPKLPARSLYQVKADSQFIDVVLS